MQRTSKECNISADRLSAGKPRNSLGYHCLENGSRNIFSTSPLVDERLNVCLCKNTAASSNWIDCSGTACKLVESGGIRFKKSSHLVNEGSRTAGTGSIHSLLHASLEICNLGIFTTKLNDNVCLWNDFAYSCSCRNNFLDKRYVKPLGNRESSGSCNLKRKCLVLSHWKLFLKFIKSTVCNCNDGAPNVCPVSLICTVQKLVIVPKSHNLYCRGTNVNTNADRFYDWLQ